MTNAPTRPRGLADGLEAAEHLLHVLVGGLRLLAGLAALLTALLTAKLTNGSALKTTPPQRPESNQVFTGWAPLNQATCPCVHVAA